MKRFTDSHEWIEMDGNIGVVGVTTYAQKELGEIVFVALPELGRRVEAGEEIAVLESTKAAIDIYAPVGGDIVEVNHRIKETPDLLNQSPEKEGWIYKIELSEPLELSHLLSKENYEKLVNDL